ncbi:calpastatin-like isoform X1 [Scleropages formosus]|uniref:Calpastatin n=1 Tax=Scleropages formosus TaxID=113540 RepID=A0A8C9U0K4_SCLFO|nr:calpastatin-like isoform X1 [Scleropages formosus]
MPSKKRKHRRRRNKGTQKNATANTKDPGTAGILAKDRAMPLSALSALGETLPAPESVLKPCKISPAAIIEEGSLKASTAIRVGEREDSLPPKYRTPKETVPQPPAPDKMPPSMDSAGALDILSGDFKSPEGLPDHQTCGNTPKASNERPSMDSAEALNILSGDFKHPVNPPPDQPSLVSASTHKLSLVDAALGSLEEDLLAQAVTPNFKSSMEVPTKAKQQFSAGPSDAFDALSNTLMDSSSGYDPTPVPTEEIIENIIVEKHVGKLGERDDTLPPNYRFPKAPLDGGQNQEKDTAFKKESEKVVEKMPASGEGPGQNGSDVLPVTS